MKDINNVPGWAIYYSYFVVREIDGELYFVDAGHDITEMEKRASNESHGLVININQVAFEIV